MVKPAEGGDGVETRSSGEQQLPEAKSTAVAQPVSVVAGSPTAQSDGRQPKRTRDIAEVADSNTVGGRTEEEEKE